MVRQPMWRIFTILLACILAASNTHAVASPQSAEAISNAITTCERGTQGGKIVTPNGGEYFSGSFITGSIEDLPEKFRHLHLPDLLQRYGASRSVSGEKPSLYIRYSSPDGEAWSVFRTTALTCDVVLTGFRGSQSEQEVLNGMKTNGWTVIASRAAIPPSRFSRYLMVKMLPETNISNYGLRANLTSIGFNDKNSSDVQMEIDFVAGQLEIKKSQ